jgi:protein ImuB
VAQARTIEPDLIVRPFSLEGVHSAQEALVDVALSITPRVEDATPGRVALDLGGTDALFPSERGLMTALESRLLDVGLDPVRIGIGETRTVAELAALHRDGGAIVEAAEGGAFLGPLPLDLLEPPDEVFDRLTRWGIHTLGELAGLPREALGTRLGEEGVQLARRARGEDLLPFRPAPARLRFEESVETGYPVENLESLAFPLRGVADRLARRLRMRGLAVREILIELVLESGMPYARTVSLGAPTVEVPVLTSLVRLALEKDPPGEPVERLRLIATPGSIEAAQLDLFLPARPAPAELAVTMARLEALCGPGRIGAPRVEDTHRPDAARVSPFEAPSGVSSAACVGGASIIRDHDPAPAMALRALRPPRSVRVIERDELPHRVELSLEVELPATRAAVGGGRATLRPSRRREASRLEVVNHAGPWRLFGEWWGEGCFARDYFDVELSDGGVYRLYHNLDDDSWYVDGIYD